MILDKPRALIFAGVFCLAAAAGGARAAEVYPGCAEPGPIGKVWYVDPVNGKTPADGGNGSQAAPWNSLQGVVSSVNASPATPGPCSSTIPYRHVRSRTLGTRIYAYADQRRRVVQPGDEILLMSGQYGDIFIGAYGTLDNQLGLRHRSPPLPARRRCFASLDMSADQHVALSASLGSEPGEGPSRAGWSLSAIRDRRCQPPTSFSNRSHRRAGKRRRLDAGRLDRQVALSGFSAMSGPDGLNTTCVSFTGGKIYGARYAVSLFSHNSVFSHNTIDHFGDDGLDYGANDLHHQRQLRSRQPGHRRRQPPGLHAGFPRADQQSDRAEERQGRFLHRLLKCRHRAQPLHPADGSEPQIPLGLQGIDAFDSDWTNLTVVNNVVVTSACWGIGFASVHGGKIINNTVLDDGSNAGTKNPAGKIVCQPAGRRRRQDPSKACHPTT